MYDLFKQLAANNTLYAEIRFAPLQHLLIDLTANKVVAAIEAATASAINETGVQARLILCTLRHYSAAQSMETVLLVEHLKNTLVAGFDIAADEAGFLITSHISALGMQKKGASIAPPMPAKQRVRKVFGKHWNILAPAASATE